MKDRKYEIRHSEAEGEPVIKRGEYPIGTPERRLIPKGYHLDVVQNTPNLKIIFVKRDL
jgi:hypothetical protein